MKYLLSILSILTANQIFAQSYPIKNIYATDYWVSQNKKFKDTIVKYTITSIDSVLSNNDTIFEIKYYEDVWSYENDSLRNISTHKKRPGGFIMNGKKEGTWKESKLTQDCKNCEILNEYVDYYRGVGIAHFLKLPILSFDKYYFIKDTADFYLPPSDSEPSFSSDTMFFKITQEQCWIYIGKILVDSTELYFFEDKVLDMLTWNTRKYLMKLDSIRNSKNY